MWLVVSKVLSRLFKYVLQQWFKTHKDWSEPSDQGSANKAFIYSAPLHLFIEQMQMLKKQAMCE